MRSGSAGIPWNYSIHVHYTLDSVQGWPKIAIQLWQLDDYGCQDIGGYGTAYLPMPRCGWVGGWTTGIVSVNVEAEFVELQRTRALLAGVSPVCHGRPPGAPRQLAHCRRRAAFQAAHSDKVAL
ncbi:conserved hypothetical protein [Leishmania braziliensis MHOM/BR/75/M2904]|uniref:Uncharacterized protein n=1 Tax=Leishmania braziliensis TaxID=5660 RepID=A4HDX9_LEIBR|nr:conserved hypothetical protein [Leishmania braziliensis MHOM/BR/75/M2904]CAM39031.1 conserved hypothetical protein [Leishmania braziliensis MHOM/BR/75/M2904]